ncbi:MAG: Glutamyl-tRNA(Gln) amidotransferase subunit [Verrucomicrobiota bacterium]|jgi:aspartyl-tRNA(Asn)/glutamyl-tRNA(Gln) amidotransferase subunit C
MHYRTVVKRLELNQIMSTELDIQYTARLARMELSTAEAETFQRQLQGILGYVEKLKEVNVEGVAPMHHTAHVFNVLRSDAEQNALTQREALQNAPRQASNLFIVTKVIE